MIFLYYLGPFILTSDIDPFRWVEGCIVPNKSEYTPTLPQSPYYIFIG